jgi:arsenite methyltransferase
MKMKEKFNTQESVQEYYGRVLNSQKDLQTSACCAAESPDLYIREILKEIHPEVLDRFYGCGSPLPFSLKGKTVLDLGSGSGRDCFVLSKLVGEEGKVIGVDMTEEQLDVARRHISYHTEKFGFQKPNLTFAKGYIEDLESADIPSDSVDVVVSNCVLNLSPDKERVFREIFRVLKPGGELFFSDVFSDRRIPQPLTEDPVLLGECLGGALYVEDFRRLLLAVGCADYRVVSNSKVEITQPDVARKIGMVKFSSLTIRAFKLSLEDRCEDFGQTATYRGTVPESPHHFTLDDHHVFEAGKPMLVCGNTAAMLSHTRYAEHFKVTGDRTTHFGIFKDCAPSSKPSSDEGISGACC